MGHLVARFDWEQGFIRGIYGQLLDFDHCSPQCLAPRSGPKTSLILEGFMVNFWILVIAALNVLPQGPGLNRFFGSFVPSPNDCN